MGMEFLKAVGLVPHPNNIHLTARSWSSLSLREREKRELKAGKNEIGVRP